MELHIPTGHLKHRSGLEPVPRFEPITYQPISRRLSNCAIGAGRVDGVDITSTHYTSKRSLSVAGTEILFYYLQSLRSKNWLLRHQCQSWHELVFLYRYLVEPHGFHIPLVEQ